MDSFDHKPELEKRDGQPLPGEENMVTFQGKNGPLMRVVDACTLKGAGFKKVSFAPPPSS